MMFSADNERDDFRERLEKAGTDEVMRAVLSAVRRRLPPRWTLETGNVSSHVLRPDAGVRLRAPDGREALLTVEAKRLLNARDVPLAIERLRSAGGPEQRAVPLLIARYLPASTQERIAAAGASYADATGNVRIVSDDPAVFLRDVGASRDPWRGPGRPRGSLRGAIAARIVRALVDFSPPMSVLELAERSRASVGATYRLTDFAGEEGLLRRPPRGPIEHVDWRTLLERWTRDYDFLQVNAVSSYLAPRGIDGVVDRLRSLPDDAYAITGSLAAHRFAPYAPARTLALYATDVGEAPLPEMLGLRRVDGGANVLVASSPGAVALDRTQREDDLTYVAPSQAAADLLTGPGRNPSEGIALLDWMEAHEREWRR